MAVLSLVLLGGILGTILAIAAVWLSVAGEDPLVQQLFSVLPGYNCGACGRSGCLDYAEALAGNALLDLCRPGGQKVINEIAEILHKDVPDEQVKHMAFVFCQGGARAVDVYAYAGISSCQAAVLLQGGYKKCARGCLGFGDCREACLFEAITLNEDGVPKIDPDKCMDCGACLKVCPKGIIRRVPQREMRRVVCSNQDNAKEARQTCAVACIGCGICVKKCPFQAIELQNNLAVIDSDKCTNCGECVSVCVTKAVR